MSIEFITLDFSSEPVDLFCPVCGVQVFTHGAALNICHHVIFSADSETESWTWHQKQYAQDFYSAIDEKYATACKNGFFADLETYINSIRANVAASLAAATISRKSAVMISISTSDIGCGGMHNGTIHALFDYLPTRPKLIQPGTLINSLGGSPTS